MFRRSSVNFAVLSILLDGVFTFLSLLTSVVLRPTLPPALPLLQPFDSVRLPIVLYVIIPALWIGVFFLISAYDPRQVYRVLEESQRVILGAGVATLSSAGLLYLTFRDVSRWLFIVFVLINTVLLLGWRGIARIVWQMNQSPSTRPRVLIIGAGEVGQRVAQRVRECSWARMELIGYLDDNHIAQETDLPLLGTLGDVQEVIQKHKIDEVVIALPRRAYQRLNQLVTRLHENPVQVRVVPDYFSLALYRASVDDFAGIPMIDLRAPALNDVQRLFKRFFDLVVGSILLLLTSPLMGLVALAIKIDSPGPVLFRQERIGENGHPFTMYKFRSMIHGADELQEQVSDRNGEGHIIHKKPDDPRVTRVGRLIRRFSLDELPQLFNVLKGEMSLVGPRPEVPWLVEQYEPWQRKRFSVPQGVTGWWQINGRSEKPMHLHTEEDLYYIQNYSPLLDLMILWKTLWVVLQGKGAY